MCLEHSTNKKKMVIVQLLFEPFHLMFALMKGFLIVRLKIYKYFLQNIFRIMKNKKKENKFFDRYYEMDGIFNEVNLNSLTFRFLNFLAKILFYFYHH